MYCKKMTDPYIIRDSCIRFRKGIPDIKPVIYSLSPITSSFGKFQTVYVNGNNFFPNGVSRIIFGNKEVDVNYISINEIYFDVPNYFPGVYNVAVKNNYVLKAIYLTGVSSPLLNVSNIIPFTITGSIFPAGPTGPPPVPPTPKGLTGFTGCRCIMDVKK